MPTVNGKKYPYTKAGMQAAEKARRAKNPDEVKTKSDMMADNIRSSVKNMGGGY